MRRMNYFVGEAERLYRQLLHDQLRYYNLYDFSNHEEENPVVSEVPDDSDATKKTEKSDGDKLIEEKKQDAPLGKDGRTTIEDLKKAAIEAETKAT